MISYKYQIHKGTFYWASYDTFEEALKVFRFQARHQPLQSFCIIRSSDDIVLVTTNCDTETNTPDYEDICIICSKTEDNCTCIQCPSCKGKGGYIDYAYNNNRGYDQDVDCGWCDGIGKIEYEGWEHPEYTKWKRTNVEAKA